MTKRRMSSYTLKSGIVQFEDMDGSGISSWSRTRSDDGSAGTDTTDTYLDINRSDMAERDYRTYPGQNNWILSKPPKEPPVDYDLKVLPDARSNDDKKSPMRLLSEFAERTSMVGVPYIHTSVQHVTKLIWTILLLAAVGAMIFHLVFLCQQYYSWPKQTKITIEFSNLPPPAISICNTNPIRQSQLSLASNKLRELISSTNPNKYKRQVEEMISGSSGDEAGGSTTESGTGGRGRGRTGESGGSDAEGSTTESNTGGNEDGNGAGGGTESGTTGSNTVGSESTTGSNTVGSESTTGSNTLGSEGTTGSNSVVSEGTTGSNTVGSEGTTGNRTGGRGGRGGTGGKTRSGTAESTTGGTGGGGGTEDVTTGSSTVGIEDGDVTEGGAEGGTTGSNTVGSEGTTGSNTVGSEGTTGSNTVNSEGTTGSNTVGSEGTTESNTVGSEGTTGSNTVGSEGTTGSNTVGSEGTTGSNTGGKGGRGGGGGGGGGGGKNGSRNGGSAGGATGGAVNNDTGTDTGSVSRKRRFVEDLAALNLTNSNEKPIDVNSGDDTLAALRTTFKHLYMKETREVRYEMGHNLKSMLIQCAVNGKKCSTRDFTSFQSETYGNCFTLQLNESVIEEPGVDSGIEMILFLETPEYIHGITDGHGARLVIHEPDTIPHPTQEGFFVPAAFETSIGLKLVTVSRLSTPFGTCTDQDQFFQQHGVKYTFQTCLLMCKSSLVIKACNCVGPRAHDSLMRTNISSDIKLCLTNREKKCANRFSDRARSKTLQCDCPQACKENKYTKFISSHQYPTSEYVYMLLQGVCEANRRRCAELNAQLDDPRLLSLNFLKLAVYYEELNYEHIVETPEIEDAQFLSDVGGALGLWIGLSLLSLFEVLQLIVELMNLLLLRPSAIRPRKDSRP